MEGTFFPHGKIELDKNFFFFYPKSSFLRPFTQAYSLSGAMCQWPDTSICCLSLLAQIQWTYMMALGNPIRTGMPQPVPLIFTVFKH